MNKILFAILFLPGHLVILSTYGQEIHSVFDLRQEPNNIKYYIGWGVRTNTFTGHSFVIFGRENSETRSSEIELISFYPDHDGFPLDRGKIMSEFESRNFVSDYNHIIFVTDQRDYANAKIVMADAQSNPGLYSVVGSNCGNLVQTIIGRIGIKLPSPDVVTPFSHMTSTINLLKNGGLQYKERSLLRTENFDQTIIIVEDINNPASSVARTTGFNGFQYGRFKNGKFDGPVLTDNGREFGKMIFHYNEGVVDFSKTEIIDPGTSIGMGHTFVNLNTPQIETYPDGSKRTIDIDITNGNKLSSVFETTDWTCKETYFSDFTFYSDCNCTDGSRAQGDQKIIIEDNMIKIVPSTDRFKWTAKNFTFEGSLHYANKELVANGILRISNGDTYEGQLVNWKFHGQGKYTHTESCSSFLGIRFGNCNSFTNIGDWSNGKFNGPSTGPVSPQDGIADGSEFKVDLPSPNTNPNDSKPVAVPSPTPNPTTLNPSEPNPSPPTTGTTNERERSIPRVNTSNSYYDPDSGRWILL